MMNEALLVLFLIFMSAFFSAAEASLMRLNRYKIIAASEKSRLAKITLKLLNRMDQVLVVILLGNTFANILSGAFTATILSEGNYSDSIVFAAPMLLSLIIFMFAEVLPKTIATNFAESISYITSPIISAILFITYPAIYLIIQINNTIIKSLGLSLKKKQDIVSIEEYKLMVREGMQEQSQYHHPMMMGVIELRENNVNDVMLDRSKIEFINLEHEINLIKQQILKCRHQELPVINGDIEEIVGILKIQDAIRMILKNKLDITGIKKSLKNPYFIPEKTPLHTQLMKFHQLKRKIALVVDEYGHLQGLISIDDIFQEICNLEFNQGGFSEKIQKIDENSWIIWGHVSLHHLKKKFGWEFPKSDATRLSGALIEYLECIPQQNTSILLGDLVFEILEVSQNTLLRIKVTKKCS